MRTRRLVSFSYALDGLVSWEGRWLSLSPVLLFIAGCMFLSTCNNMYEIVSLCVVFRLFDNAPQPGERVI